ncbi:MAG: DUF1287 domain-containing protein [Desulfovibrio sp.]|jgi:uncharacterized protein YijF (DUF1287 family)|nr:DUF1287 domain-containing protein [Desulfovibrio sp.]
MPNPVALCSCVLLVAGFISLMYMDRHDAAFTLRGGAHAASSPESPFIRSQKDTNGNGVSDTDDLILGARKAVLRRPIYRSAYYRGGYPPAWEGTCTDIIWHAFHYTGYDLKKMVDADIRADLSAYPRVAKPDPNIDFRRVPNLRVFFSRHGLRLTTRFTPADAKNLAEWQPGDIVTFTNPDHIAILSDIRNADGIPMLLHNDGPVASESDNFIFWYNRGITGHYRFPQK